MKITQILSGLSAAVIATSVMAISSTAANAEPSENLYYNATGTWTLTYKGSDIKKDIASRFAWTNLPEGSNSAIDGSGDYCLGYKDWETGEIDGNYHLYIKMMVGQIKNAKITVKVTSDEKNILVGDKAVSEGYMHTNVFQGYSSDDSRAEYEDVTISDWDIGSGYFGVGSGYSKNFTATLNLTNDNIESLNFEITVKADSDTLWQYKPYKANDPDEYKYEFIKFGNNGFTPDSWSGSSDLNVTEYYNTSEVHCTDITIDGDYINKQIPGAVCRPSVSSSSGKAESSSSSRASSSSSSKPSSSSSSKPSSSSSSKPSSSSSKADSSSSKTDSSSSKADSTTTKPAAKKTSIKKTTIKLAKTKVVYTGKARVVGVTVKDGKTKLKKGTDYTLTFKNNKNTGKATVTIKGKGNYTGSVTKSFIIVPKKPAKPTVKALGKQKVKVTVKKTKLATGYQIQCSTSKKFTKKTTKTATLAKYTKNVKTFTKLKKGKVYYVRSRSYIKVGTKKYYGAFSATKSVRVK